MIEPHDEFDEDAGATVFRDVILLALLGFVAIVVLLLPHINPEAAEEPGVSPMSGNVVVEIHWPDEIDVDVDLWVRAPDDVPVGYSNKGGRIFNLLRDDLGHSADVSEDNYEISYSRGIPEGEYQVNVHLYRNADRIYPVPVSAIASVRLEGEELKQILASEVLLAKENEEITVFRFELDGDGALVEGSVHSLQHLMRSWTNPLYESLTP